MQHRSIQNAISSWLSAAQFTSPSTSTNADGNSTPALPFPLAAGFLCMPISTGLIASSSAAWIVVFLDFVWCFRAERECIWRRQPNTVRAVYIFSRVCPILALLANLVLLSRFSAPLDVKLCRSWFLFLHSSNASVQVVLTTTLYLRINALYLNRLRTRLLCIGAVVLDAVVIFVAGLLIFFYAEFDGQCSAGQKRFGYTIPFVFLANQSLAWGLTWYGRHLLSRELRPLGGTELVQMVPFLPILFRDSSIILSVVLLGFAVAFPYTATNGIQTLSIYPWSITGLSCFTCHLILNLFRAGRPPSHFDLTDPALELVTVHLEIPPPVYLHPTLRGVAREVEGLFSSSGTIHRPSASSCRM